MCLYLVCISVCVCVCYTYVRACVSVPEGVRVCVSVCLCVCPEQSWGTLWRPALRSTVHRDRKGSGKATQTSLCLFWALTGKELQQAEIEEKGFLKKEKNTWEKAEGGDCTRHVPCAHVSGGEELNGKARPRKEASKTGRQLHFRQSLNLHLDYASESKWGALRPVLSRSSLILPLSFSLAPKWHPLVFTRQTLKIYLECNILRKCFYVYRKVGKIRKAFHLPKHPCFSKGI